ncbi:MAG: adenylyl cyclase class-3/4/guanylyl cyclase [Mycobacterium sp.]|uniref:ATP-binding protein n=1 Tax=Mycobacterium sp. TaxID=1785 RepID=UPI00263563B4|nr:adenylate/guanylate cyclase domain-containing protein [Mycobacterium sp.]MCW2662989.1 adenylyl cyclase class-3/4/guanylyl cyclase [Mycobacterium sp.]
MDNSGDGRGAPTAAALSCGSCGTLLGTAAKFCSECGTPVAHAAQSAEYKQVTILFADVVHSMDIAAAVGAERLREIMAELLDRAVMVVQRYGGTVDKFTGDGIMAVFGAPIALEDHAIRACLAALGLQETAQRLAIDVRHRDRVELRLRVGLNSGQVIAGEIGSGPLGYTAIGEQVGMAQRMESVAPPDGVMLSDSTARLVRNAAALGEPELVHIKGGNTVIARRLLAIGEHQPRRRTQSKLVGRTWELTTISGILEEAIAGTGCIVNIVGPAGIGKSRLVRETATLAGGRGVPVFSTYCESHATDIPFRVVARMLRAALGVDELSDDAARKQVRDRFPAAAPEDLLLLDDMLGIRDAATTLPDISPDARRRRLTALINAGAVDRPEAAVYVIEDAHWIDEISESLLAEFLGVVPQIPSLVLITYRPEYQGALGRIPGAQTIALRPLTDAHTLALTTELLGAGSSTGELGAQIAGRAAGNPFFVEEIVRDLAERGVLHGQPGAYQPSGDAEDVDVPATLQATIGARIDRLGASAKQTLNAAAVIGARFDADLLAALVPDVDVVPLTEAELVNQVRFAPYAEYAFCHPLIRTVAYESQLKSVRAQSHRRLAAVIEARASADENAALIAEHVEAAGDLHAAFDWHMRAGTWSAFRDMVAAQTSWRRARRVTDRLAQDDPDRLTMSIAPRTLLCAQAYRVGGSGADTGFEELRELCTAAADQQSLAIGMAGQMTWQTMKANRREASELADELVELLEAIGDSMLTVALAYAAMLPKHDTAEMADVLRFAQLAIDLAEGDPAKGDLIFESPLTLAITTRGFARWCMGIAGWRDDFDQAITTARALLTDPGAIGGVMWFTYGPAIPYGVLLSDAAALRDTAEFLSIAEQSGDDLALDLARGVHGLALAYQDGPARTRGFELLAKVRERCANNRFALNNLPLIDVHIAREKARTGDIGGAIELARTVADELFNSGGCIWTALATSVLVEALLQRGGEGDLDEAASAIDQLAAAPTDPGFILHEISLLRLRALLARARGDEAAYRDYRDRYRGMATSLGFEGHMKWAEAMP